MATWSGGGRLEAGRTESESVEFRISSRVTLADMGRLVLLRAEAAEMAICYLSVRFLTPVANCTERNPQLGRSTRSRNIEHFQSPRQ